MKQTKALREAVILLGAGLMAAAPGIDFTLQRKALPDATDFFGLIDQMIARTFGALQTDTLSMAVLFAAFWWLLRRFLFHKPKETKSGEYLLCGVLSGIMLLYAAVKAQGGIGILYANVFQILKAGLYWGGMYLIFLCLLRGLRELLLVTFVKPPQWRLMKKKPFLASALVIGLCWLPQVIVKYPGVLMWDSYNQIKQFTGEYVRTLNHPPFGTLLYGSIYSLGQAVGNINLIYFLFTLARVVCFVAVLAYSLVVMKRLSVGSWVCCGALTLYAVSPCYAGWAVVIGKDADYLLLCLWLCVLLLDWLARGKRFFDSWERPAMLCADLALLMLTRHNGALIAVPVLAVMLIALLMQKASRRQLLAWACMAAASAALMLGVKAAIVQSLDMKPVYLQDSLSLPFQQTARVVKLHGDELPLEEHEAIDRVLDYEKIGDAYEETYADAVKDTYRQSATAEDRAAYMNVWIKHLLRYPVDYADALLHMNGVMFDLKFNYPMYISLSDAALTDYVYPMSFNDMKLYDREPLVALNSAQRALTRWYDHFDKLPFIGLFATMGFCNVALIALLYLAWVNGRKRALMVMLPAAVTAIGCLFSPVVYLRYALPMVCTLPFWIAAYQAAGYSAPALPEDGTVG